MAEEFRSNDFSPLSSPAERYILRHTLTGHPKIVRRTIHQLHNLGYAPAGNWSPLQPTGQPDEVLSLLIQSLWIE